MIFCAPLIQIYFVIVPFLPSTNQQYLAGGMESFLFILSDNKTGPRNPS